MLKEAHAYKAGMCSPCCPLPSVNYFWNKATKWSQLLGENWARLWGTDLIGYPPSHNPVWIPVLINVGSGKLVTLQIFLHSHQPHPEGPIVACEGHWFATPEFNYWNIVLLCYQLPSLHLISAYKWNVLRSCATLINIPGALFSAARYECVFQLCEHFRTLGK